MWVSGEMLFRAVTVEEARLLCAANHAIPELFKTLFPTWLAALLGVGVLSAVMSTADGLVVSSSQIFANDIYRRTLAPKIHADRTPEQLERTTLQISRIGTAVVLVGSAGLALVFMNRNIALLAWIGIGAMMAAITGPLVIGSVPSLARHLCYRLRTW